MAAGRRRPLAIGARPAADGQGGLGKAGPRGISTERKFSMANGPGLRGLATRRSIRAIRSSAGPGYFQRITPLEDDRYARQGPARRRRLGGAQDGAGRGLPCRWATDFWFLRCRV